MFCEQFCILYRSEQEVSPEVIAFPGGNCRLWQHLPLSFRPFFTLQKAVAQLKYPSCHQKSGNS